jgi:hypothetical protein
VGRIGEVLVSILGHRGLIPLLFAPDELDPAYVHGIVRDTVDRSASEVMRGQPRINEAGAVDHPGGVVRKRCVTCRR